MRVDIGNALAAEADPGISRDALERLDEDVTRAHDRIETGRVDGEFGYTALNLPERTDAEAILTVGIGGSALGAATISETLGGLDSEGRSPSGNRPQADDGEGESAETPPLYVLDNVDPAHVREILADVPLDRTAVNVVSRSGTTAETLSNFLVVREAMDEAGVDWTERTVVTTGEDGPLRELADRHDMPALDVPTGVPGRFSALSAVGLVPAAIQGHDIEGLLAGGQRAADSLAPSLFDSPAYAYGAVSYALAQRGAGINAMVPYAERLEFFAEWFAQLWAESLGKDGLGQTPARALGATDQHSQLQLYRAGPRDKLVTMVRPRERADREIPETDIEGLSYLGGSTLGDLLDAEFEATEASLAAADRPSVRIEVERLDAERVGELLYAMEAACVLYGELANVSTFDQPAVEWGKRAARGLLGGGEFEEAEAVADKTELVVE